MKSFYLTDVGKVRDHNEDNVVIVKNKNNECLMAVADGMGGHSAGEIASSLAIDYLVNSFNDNFNKFYPTISIIAPSSIISSVSHGDSSQPFPSTIIISS